MIESVAGGRNVLDEMDADGDEADDELAPEEEVGDDEAEEGDEADDE